MFLLLSNILLRWKACDYLNSSNNVPVEGLQLLRRHPQLLVAGGAHHTAFSFDLTAEQMGDWAEAMGIEAVYIDKDTTIRQLKNELRWNALAYRK